jgi:hypothetical protein
MSNADVQFEVDEVDVESEAKAGNAIRRARRYRLRIDSEYKVSNSRTITGREVLALVGKTPEQFVLTQKVRGGGTLPVTADQVVDLHTPGIERFMTLARDATDGQQARLQFSMRSTDVENLTARGLRWEAVRDSQGCFVLIHDFPIPEGYNHKTALLALQLPDGYPDQQIDMAYFSPALQRMPGKVIPNLSDRPIMGLVFQQWSRHRTPQNPWRVGIDDLGTHLVLVGDWLVKELAR